MATSSNASKEKEKEKGARSVHADSNTAMQDYLLKLAGRDGANATTRPKSAAREAFELRQLRHLEDITVLEELLAKATASSSAPAPSPSASAPATPSKPKTTASQSRAPGGQSVKRSKAEEADEEAKWAGGAFENSPDPDTLPFPSAFLTR